MPWSRFEPWWPQAEELRDYIVARAERRARDEPSYVPPDVVVEGRTLTWTAATDAEALPVSVEWAGRPLLRATIGGPRLIWPL